ncbi:ABC transporter ATP-binding protein [Enterocloster sp. 210928-DFI.2.20]|jgi:branched-chain amino acid transport system ATP-binding protein|nr:MULTISPECIES: ABC transporter ATP-binding protein [Enterocloster]MCB7094907.1 ABC transporter ATP-binding protein [Enterocloster sp. 210928-DFI.2.20]MCB7354302.1 ABC transporter ATP-binding protein [Enterocloster bolteae]
MIMLEVKNLKFGYSAMMPVLNDISFQAGNQEIVAILGSNGAGKTTTLKTVSGLLKPWEGSITYNGEDITGMPAYGVLKKGISLVPEGRMLFGKLTVYENLSMGAYTRKNQDEIKKTLDMVYELFPRVRERAEQKAETLSGGEQQMVAIARGLMSNPSLLILDEPSLGLMPKLVKEVLQFVKTIRETGISVLIVEQNVNETLAIADRAYVIQDGSTVISGAPEELKDNDEIRRIYLGM